MKKLLFLLVTMLATSMGLQAQGTSWQTATLITSGSTKTGTLDSSTTEAWYKINVTQEGKIDLIATASGDLRFYPYNCAVYGFKDNNTYYLGTIFTGNMGNTSTADTITYHASNVGKGTYYVRITRQSGSGTFKLKYTFTPCPLANDPEPNDDYQHASLLQSGETVECRLGYHTSDDYTDKEDYFKIVVPEEGHVDMIATATEDLRFYPYYCALYGFKDNNTYYLGTIFTGNMGNTSTADTITYHASNVGKGTYYVRITRQSGSGGYRLKYTFTPCPLANDPEPNDDYQHASLLQSGQTVECRLGYHTSDDYTDKEDFFKIVVPEEGHVDMIATATEDLRFYPYYCALYGYKNNDTYWLGTDFIGNMGNTSTADTITYHASNVGKGTYYVRITRQNGSGGYKLKYTFTPCPLANDVEPNGDYQTAAWLPSGKTKQGRLGYHTSDDITDTEDWYRISVTKAGPIEITATATENLRFYPYNSAIYGINNNGGTYYIKTFTGNLGNSSTADVITLQAEEFDAGTYYVRISRQNGSGGYRITYNGPTLTGDVDGDHKVVISDVTDIISYLLGIHGPSFATADADVDGDGRITINDVTELISMLLSND